MGCGNDPAARSIFGAGEALGKRPGIQDTPNPLIFHHNGRRRYAGTPMPANCTGGCTIQATAPTAPR